MKLFITLVTPLGTFRSGPGEYENKQEAEEAAAVVRAVFMGQRNKHNPDGQRLTSYAFKQEGGAYVSFGEEVLVQSVMLTHIEEGEEG